MIIARSLKSRAIPTYSAQNKAKLTRDHGGRQQSTLEVRRNISGSGATTADALATLLPIHLPLFAKKSRSRCLDLAPWSQGLICYMFMLSQIWAGATNCVLFSRGDGHVWIINTTINYLLNTCTRFWGCRDDENGRTACVIAVWPYLRFKIRL